MNAPADPPTVVAAPQEATTAKGKRRQSRLPTVSRRVGCLAVWLAFLTPAAYSLLVIFVPALGHWLVEKTPAPPLVKQWLSPGPARSLRQWLDNVDPGPTMVYLIFAAVLVLFSVAVFVREESSSRQ